MKESDYLRDSKKIIDKLKQIPTLCSFSEKELHGALQLSKIRKYEPEELIIEEGSYDQWVYFLVSGKVRIVKQGKELSVLGRIGDVFGEMGVIDGSARSASVYAVDQVVCLACDASHADRLSGSDRLAFTCILYQVFAELLANRLRKTSEELIKAEKEISSLKSRLNK
ncbi:MAG: cyclic nucleotide-binding domain-containing protein [Desulfobacterales bacterium]|nr:cyclic nucleotide-binding domain-containing protein [Desulfobacterales bacterium]